MQAFYPSFRLAFASSSSWSTSTTGACRPAARPPASARPGSGGAARAPPKPVAPLSVERRVVAGSPREPGRSKPLSCQLQPPDNSSYAAPGCTNYRGRRLRAAATSCRVQLFYILTERSHHRRLPDHAGLPLLRCHLLAPSTSMRSGGATSEAKRGAPAAAPAQPARSSVIIC